MIKRGLTLDNALNITPHIFINDAVGSEAAGQLVGCTTGPVRTSARPGQGRRRAPEADRHSQEWRIMGREVVVAVTDGRLGGSTELAEVFGAWEQILCQLDG